MSPKLFYTDSEDDSIGTEYTTQDDGDGLYDIEKILSQKDNYFLIKWQGYATPEATWEPRDGLPPDDSEIWVEWRRHLKAVRDGREQAFDQHQWQKEWEKHRDEKNRRRARRNAKRRKKNLPTRPDTLEEESTHAADSHEEEDSEDDAPLALRTANRRAPPQQPVHRKGVAQKLTKPRREQRNASSSSDESAEITSDDSEESLVVTGSQKVKLRSPSSIKRPSREDVRRKRSQTSSVVSPKKQRLNSHSKSQVTQDERIHEAQPQQRPSAPMRTQSSQSAIPRKNVPSSSASVALPARAKKSKNVMSNWDGEAKKRKRVPKVGSVVDETARPGFLHLRMQHAVQKSTREEGAPDLSTLNIIDPKTGNVVVPSKVSTASVAAAEQSATKTAAGTSTAPGVTASTPPATIVSGIDGAYSRRSPPPSARNPEALPVRSTEGSASDLRAENTSEHQHSATSGDANASLSIRKTAICRFWREGTCKHSAQNCSFAHSFAAGDATKIGGEYASKLRLPPPDERYDPGQLRCHFFRTHGICKRGAVCKYAHHDTPYDAPPPGVTVEDVRASQLVYAQSTMSRDPQKTRKRPDSGKQHSSDLTCYFWRTQNSCKKGKYCPFSHSDTGFNAPPPPGILKNMLRSNEAPEPRTNLAPMGNHRWTSGADAEVPRQYFDRPVFGEPHYAKVPEATPARMGFHGASDLVLSPEPLIASPMHTSLPGPQISPESGNSLWDVGSASAAVITRSAMLKLYHQGSEHPHSIRLTLDVFGDDMFTRMVGDSPVLCAEHAILTSDVQAVLWQDIQNSSNAASAVIHMDVSPKHEVSSAAELCKLHECCLLASVEGYSATNVLVYPSNAEQWKFLDTPGLPSDSSASLKLCAFDGCPDLRRRLSSRLTPMRLDPRSPALIVGEVLAQVERSRIFDKGVEAVFLMIPPAHAAELDFLKQVFVEMKCRVYHAGMPGSWSYFCKRYDRAGVVLVHPNTPLWRIPKLHEMTLRPTSFFTIGIDHTAALLDDREDVFECTRLFPLGGAALLTDDLIAHYPEEATEIIQNFLNATSSKPEGAEVYKIVARPGLKRFLLENFIERGRPDERWLRLYGAVCDLCPPEDEDLEDPPNPLATSHLVSINPDLLPSFAGLWERDQEAAADVLVEWFAGWALLHASRFRKFAVITGTGADDRGWALRYRHIGVMRPEQAMKYVIRGNKPQKGIRNWKAS